jgi:hypothetical protein
MVPITAEVTFEDPTIVDPKKRFIFFGQEDHVRRYGHDFVDRLKSVGFDLTLVTINGLIHTREEMDRLGLAFASDEL